MAFGLHLKPNYRRNSHPPASREQARTAHDQRQQRHQQHQQRDGCAQRPQSEYESLRAFLLGQVSWQWLHRESAKPPENSPGRAAGMGAVAGVMLGTVGMPSHIIASYLTGLRLTKSRYLFVLSSSQVCLRLAAMASLFMAGAYTREAIWLMLAVSIPVFMGYFAGTRLYDWLPEKAFFRTVLALLLVMALSLVAGNADAVFSWWASPGA